MAEAFSTSATALPMPGFPATYVANSPRLFDTLINNVGSDQTWDETRFDTGAVFHYPAGTLTSLAYYKTVQGQYMTMNYNTNGSLDTIMEPAGRELQYNYTGPYVTSIEDWVNAKHTVSVQQRRRYGHPAGSHRGDDLFSGRR